MSVIIHPFLSQENLSNNPRLITSQSTLRCELFHVQGYIGGRAAAACNQMGAAAYASGNQIAFKETPSVELAAHEAAHVVQQASGKVQLSGGVGKVGDQYEQHADDVAARAAAGQSAKNLLAEYGNNSMQQTVQAKVSGIVQEKCNKCTKQKKSAKTANNQQTVNDFFQPNISDSNVDEIANTNTESTVLAMNPKGICIQPGDMEGWRARAREALRKGGDSLDEFCYELTKLIEDCHGDLHKRLNDMLNDLRTGQEQYLYRRFMRDHPEGNTWEGHQNWYEGIREVMRELIGWWYDHCNSGDDGKYFLPVIEAANIARQTAAPKEPLAKNNQALLEQALNLGAELKDGALWVGSGIATGIVIIIAIIAKSLGIPMYQY